MAYDIIDLESERRRRAALDAAKACQEIPGEDDVRRAVKALSAAEATMLSRFLIGGREWEDGERQEQLSAEFRFLAAGPRLWAPFFLLLCVQPVDQIPVPLKPRQPLSFQLRLPRVPCGIATFWISGRSGRGGRPELARAEIGRRVRFIPPIRLGIS